MASTMPVPETLEKLDMYIDGEFVEPASGEYFESFDPYTARPWALVARGNAEDADRAVQAAHRAFQSSEWRGMHPSQRGALLRRLADLVAENAERLGELEVRDNGKLLSEMAAQLRYVPSMYHYYAGLADKIEGSVIHADKPAFTFTRHEPLGVCVGIIPWNSPLMLVAWKLGPALAAGNTVVLKPSEYTSASLLEFVKLVEQAGFPKGVVNVVTGFGAEAGQPLVEHPLVRKIAFTGSDRTGAHLYSTAARDIKRVSLELGGKSPNIVFEDANLENAVKGAVAGSSPPPARPASPVPACSSSDRSTTSSSIAWWRSRRPRRWAIPCCSIPRWDRSRTCRSSRRCSATSTWPRAKAWRRCSAAAGRSVPECGDGWFVEPTIFTGVRNDMRIAQEEVFGPVLSIIPFEDDDDAVAIGNDVVFGLAAGVWTENMRRAITMSERLQAGTVWVNMYRAVSYTMPFRRLQAQRPRPRARAAGDPGVHADQERVDLDRGGDGEPLRHRLSGSPAGHRPGRAP